MSLLSPKSRMKPRLDTGYHVNNVKLIKPRGEEVFRRLKGSELCTMIQTQFIGPDENIANLASVDENESVFNNQTPSEISYSNHIRNGTNLNADRMSVTNVSQHNLGSPSDAHGIFYNGEQSSSRIEVTHSQNDQPNSLNYLLLDIRSAEQFAKFHVQSASLFDTQLMRQDRIPKEIYAYRNKDDKIIVICSDDESQTVSIAKQLIEKYIDNVFVLSMSVERFCSRYSELCDGTDPPPPPNPNELKRLVLKNRRKSHPSHSKHSKNSVRRPGAARSISSFHSCVSTRTWVP